MPYQAFVFDLDGTLLDTLEDIADACNAALAQHHFPTHPIDAYRYFVGDGVPNLMLRTIPAGHHDPATLVAVAESYRLEYQARWNVKSRPYVGVPEMLDALTQRGMALCVLSNKPDDFTRRCVAELLPKWKFTIVMGASKAFPHKPDPASALYLAKQLELPPARIIYMGDTSTDMRTAVGAGMLPVGVLWGFRTAKELEESGARHLLKEPREVLDLL